MATMARRGLATVAGATLALAGALACAHPSGTAPAGPAAPGAPDSFRVEYRPPQDPAHQVLADSLRQRKVLETFADVLSVIRLPKPLTLVLQGCDGTSNAWYSPEKGAVIFCYEYVAEIVRGAPTTPAHGLTAEDARDGPIAFVLLHETGHALFDLLSVPLLGHEEDAADQIAGYVLARTGHETARRLLGGAAWMYGREAKRRTADQSDFADVHALDAQRYYNVLCLTYGSDPEAFVSLVKNGYLPEERAETCAEEWAQVDYAVSVLIKRHVDSEAAARVRARYQRRWGEPAKGAR